MLACNDPSSDLDASECNALSTNKLNEQARTAHRCPMCKQGFSLLENLDLHMVVHEKESNEQEQVSPAPRGRGRPRKAPQIYTCDVCDFQARYKYLVAKHRKMTHEPTNKPFSCSMISCTFKTTTKGRLKQHALTHDVKHIRCDLCSYATAKMCHYKRHLLVHTGVKAFQCTHCDYRSNQLSNLKQHSRKHTGEKPYICKPCDISFFSRAGFAAHTKSKHDVDPNLVRGREDLKCSVCGANDSTFVCSPCGHRCSCGLAQCIAAVKHQGVCPHCEDPIEMVSSVLYTILWERGASAVQKDASPRA